MSLFLRRVLNRFLPQPLAEAAVSRREIAPALEEVFRPALSLPGAFDNVISVVNDGWTLERARVEGRLWQHPPTIEYVLAKARLVDRFVIAGRHLSKFPTTRPGKGSGERGASRMTEALLSTNALSGLEFGHWVRDSLVTEMHGANEGLAAIGLMREPWPHEPAFRALSGLDCQYVADCRVDRLTILDDRGHNAHWRARFRQLRERLRENAGKLPGRPAGRLLFLSRGEQARVREPVNLPAIQGALAELGFVTIVPSQMSAEDVAVALRDAQVVVSAEGSHLNHVHSFAPDRLALVSLQDPRRFYSYHHGLACLYDARFAFVVGRPDAAQPERYRIPVDDVLRTIELAACGGAAS